jgi:flagellar protein FliS
MNTGMMFGAKAYAAVGLETDVVSASPQELILMLFDGLLKCVKDARNSLKAGDIKAKCDHVTKALRIVDEGLKAAVDPRVGGDLPGQLMSLYDYLSRELLHASLHNDDARFSACADVTNELRDAWASICSPARASGAASAYAMS